MEVAKHLNFRMSESLDKQDAVSLVTVVICFLGCLGNGLVIWLLFFRMKRNLFFVYILNLACADLTFLLVHIVWFTVAFSGYDMAEPRMYLEAFITPFYLLRLCLLAAVSTEGCASVLCPVWFRCHRPEHLSTILCVLLWGLDFCFGLASLLCSFFQSVVCHVIEWVYLGMYALMFLVLCVSSLTLLLRVQCRPWKGQPTRLYSTILLNTLAFLLLELPYTVCAFTRYMPSPPVSFLESLTNVLFLLLILNCGLKLFIYLIMGRHRQLKCWKHLREILQNALTDEEEDGKRKTGVSASRQNTLAT